MEDRLPLRFLFRLDPPEATSMGSNYTRFLFFFNRKKDFIGSKFRVSTMRDPPGVSGASGNPWGGKKEWSGVCGGGAPSPKENSFHKSLNGRVKKVSLPCAEHAEYREFRLRVRLSRASLLPAEILPVKANRIRSTEPFQSCGITTSDEFIVRSSEETPLQIAERFSSISSRTRGSGMEMRRASGCCVRNQVF